MAARDLVFEAGDRVRTWGQYVAGPDGDWLDLARVDALISKPPGWKSDRSIRLIGADAEAVPTDFAANRVPDFVSVVGTWRDESIEVEEQSPDIPAREPSADWTDPPCPPPPDGWRRDALPWDLDYGDLESSGAMVHGVVFRPSADQEVLVVAATDVDAVTRQLSPHLPDQLCVVPSRFTRAQLDEVRDVLLSHWREWRLETCGTGSADAQAQPFATAEPFRVTAEMAEWADTLPAGLLRLNPAISPA
ncbi:MULTISPECIES: hypothetical protein [unclassified Kribbella]|uniref:hypothetical protein n=1 Tax=unclassified Kribbella TaxID=2644121 RepID=UPI003402BFAD